MSLADLFFIVLASLCLRLGAQGTPPLVDKLAVVKTSLGGQLTTYDKIYSTLMAGNLVRHFTAFPQCPKTTGDIPNGEGGQIDYFEAIHIAPGNVSRDSFFFSTEVLKVQPKIVAVWSLYQVSMYNFMNVEVAQVDPRTSALLSDFTCYCSINTTGTAYFYSTQSSPPPLLSTYASVHSLLQSGFVVTFVVNFTACMPKPALDTQGGGLIALYEDVAENSVNVGIQFSGRFTILDSNYLVNERSFTLYQNGTVIVDVATLSAADYSPVSQSTVACQMNDGKNGGSISFYSRGSGARGRHESSNL